MIFCVRRVEAEADLPADLGPTCIGRFLWYTGTASDSETSEHEFLFNN